MTENHKLAAARRGAARTEKMEQAVSKPLGTPSMELHQIARGLALAVEAVVENERDLTVNR